MFVEDYPDEGEEEEDHDGDADKEVVEVVISD